MKNTNDWRVPKWPFLAGDGLLLIFAVYFTWRSPHPFGLAEVAICAACVAVGAVIGVLPFILEYQATCRLIEVNGLETVVEKIQHLDRVGGQIADCTNNWTAAQTQAEKTATISRELADRMTTEARQFSEFMQRMNDSEKSALKLEIEKQRRSEADWLQVLVRILDHIFALHLAAEHSGQPRLAEQISQFQNACRDAARRVGLVPFGAEPDELFNPERHQAVGFKDNPPTSAIIAETVGSGFKYQGRMVRPVLVRLREHNEGGVPVPPEAPKTEEKQEKQMTLESPEQVKE